MGLFVQKLEQLRDPAVVEFGIQIIKEEQRILAPGRVEDRNVGELEEENSTALLTRRAVLFEIVTVKADLEVVSMRTDERMACNNFRLHAKFQTLLKKRFILRQIAFSL